MVIAIIGILSAIILASLSRARAKARDVVRETDLEQLAVSLRAFAEQNGRYPSAADGSCAYNTSFGSGGCLQALVSQDFVNVLPSDPSGQQYFYDNWCNGTGTDDKQYRLWVVGELNHDGTQYGWSSDETIGVTTCEDPT